MVQTLNPTKIFTPVSAYSHGVLIPAGAEIIVTSGAVGMDRDGNVPEDFESQCRLVWSSIEHILGEAGWGLDTIVRINGFLKRREDTPAFRAIRDEMVPQKPAATIVLAELIDPSWLIEVEVTAARVSPGAGEIMHEGSR